MNPFHAALLLGLVVLPPDRADAAVTGQWDFDGGDLRATLGAPMLYLDGPQGATAQGSDFGTTTKFGIPGIGGQPAKVLRFPEMKTATMGYTITHGAVPNGEGEQVNRYTVIMDVFFPASSADAFRSLLQLDQQGDADLYLNPAGGLGTLGDYAGNVTADAWHRLVFAVDVSGRRPTVAKFVDGVKADRQVLSQGRDGRWSLMPQFSLFQDPRDESRAGYLNSLQVRDRTLSDAEVKLLGGPSAAGIPTNDLPEHAFVDYTTPPDNAFGIRPDAVVRAEINEGRSALKPESIQLALNGRKVTAEVSRSGTTTAVSYHPPSPFRQSTNTVSLSYQSGTSVLRHSWQFVTQAQAQKRAVTGQWDFRRGDLSASIGKPLQYLDGPGGASRRAVEFGTTAHFGISDLKGKSVPVLRFAGAPTRNIGLVMPHEATPNGGEGVCRVNQWTLLLDLLVPNARSERWLALLQTDSDNTSNAELFISFTGGIGVIGSLGQYLGEGEMVAGRWHRVAVAVDGSSLTMSKYIDGQLFATQPLAATELDGRYSLAPTAALFADEDGDSQPCFVHSIQFRNYPMSEDEVAALGGPEAEGIPAQAAP